jgi:hypothetical protein
MDRREVMSDTVSAYIDGEYYPSITRSDLALLESAGAFSSGVASFERRRQFEDNAQDTVQPYDAAGNPRPEFYRLYPAQAERTFSKADIERVKKQL